MWVCITKVNVLFLEQRRQCSRDDIEPSYLIDELLRKSDRIDAEIMYADREYANCYMVLLI